MQTYIVEFSIDVEADDEESAARNAWKLLTKPDAPLPVVRVTAPYRSYYKEVDLNEIGLE